jgi:hypothetical protein
MALLIPLRRIPVWTNRRRSRFLRRFRDRIDAYFREVRYEAFPFRVVENELAASLRGDLEGELKRCRIIVGAAERVSPLRLAPGDQEGDVVRINMITEAFQLHRYNLRREDLLEVLDAARQAYDDDRGAAWVRTANPLYWLGMALGVVEVLPFLPLGWVRLDWRRAARSRPGRALRFLLRAGALAALVVVVLHVAGLQRAALDAVGRVYREAVRLPSRFLGS